jgi:hypothetical protein
MAVPRTWRLCVAKLRDRALGETWEAAALRGAREFESWNLCCKNLRHTTKTHDQLGILIGQIPEQGPYEENDASHLQ